MCLLMSLLVTLIFILLFLLIQQKRNLHFEYGAILFGGASLVWLVDGIVAWMEGDGFISFGSLGMDLIIGAYSIVLGLLLWLIIILIPFITKKCKEKRKINNK